ncbi:MAG TPA: serine/threonine-protein kinase [Gaiellaceae bacterium]|nr:serine/threonine-protein kinase [Gaiellaceae bacterium]
MRRPTRVGRYRLGSLLGAGGMAIVYRGEDGHGRQVAIKLLADNLAADAELRERFLREASIATQLDHPNVVEVLDTGEAADRPYIVMELVDGSSLAAELARDERLDEERAVDVTLQLSAALAHAHELEIVHRDVKPANILLTRDRRVKLADFGIARGLGDGTTLTTAGSVLGTVAYLSPEQARGGDVGTASDIWSLGVVISEMTTGARPAANGVSARSGAARAPGRLADIVERCLEVDPARRPTADEVAALVLASHEPTVARTRVLPTEPVADDDPPRPPGSSPVRKRSRRWAGAIAVGIVAAVVALVVVGADRTRRPEPLRTTGLEQQSPRVQAQELAAWLRAEAHG